MGEAFTRHSLRPLTFGGTRSMQDSGEMRREIAGLWSKLFEM